MSEDPTVTVMVSKELLGELEHWSAPVQVKIEKVDYGTGWEMTARTVTRETLEQVVRGA